MGLQTTYRFRIYPNVAQTEKIEKNFGAWRYVYNYFREKRIKAYENREITPNWFQQCFELTQLKQQLPWLREAESTSLQLALKNLDFAFDRFFDWRKKEKKVGFPRKKRKHEFRQSYTSRNTDNGIRVLDNKHVRLPKLGRVRCAVSKAVYGVIREATVTRSGSGKYFVCIRCEIDEEPLPRTGAVAGLAISNDGLIVDSNGNEHTFRSLSFIEQDVEHFKLMLARKPKGSANWLKCMKEFSAFFEKKQNQTTDDLNKITTQLIKEYDVIYFPMSQLESRHAGQFIRILDYKAKRYGKRLEIVSAIQVDSKTSSDQVHDLAKEVLQKGLQIA